MIAQDFDSLTGTGDWSYYTTASRVRSMQFERVSEDSTLDHPHRIHPMKRECIAWLDQGLPFTPTYSLDFQLPGTGHFQMSQPLFENSFLKSEDIRYYESEAPRTQLKYAQGTGDLINLQAEHNQKITDGWVAGLNYRRFKMQNLYYDNLALFNQQRMTNAYGAQFFTHFESGDKRYEVMADYTWNKAQLQETGGISNQIAFDTLNGRQKLYSGTGYLSEAQNLMAERGLTVRQFFRKKQLIRVNDSTLVADQSYINIKSQWFQELNMKRSQFRFTDENYNESYFPVRYLGVETNDSISLNTISNEFGRCGQISQTGLKYVASVIHELIEVNQLNGFGGNYSNVQTHANLSRNTLRQRTAVSLELVPIGYYAGDWNIGLYHTVNSRDSNWTAGLSLHSIRHRPDYNTMFFGSNYRWWHQTFGKTDNQSVELFIALPGHAKLSAAYYNIQGLVYVDGEVNTQQWNGRIGLVKLKLEGEQDVRRWLKLKYQLLYQKSDEEVLRLPDMAAKLSLYTQGYLFKNNMLAQLGFDGFFTSSFGGYQYDPASRMFYLSPLEMGGYPMVDVFLNMHVKAMKLFVVIEHVSQGYFNNDGYSLNGYPIIGRAVKFGAEWRLFN